MIRRAQSGVLAKRSREDEFDLWGPRDAVSDEMVVGSDVDSHFENDVDDDDESPRRRTWTKVQFALAALSATPILFIGGIGGWPWDNEPAVANNPSNTVVAGHEHYPASVAIARLGINTSLDALNLDPVTQVLQVPGLGRAGWYESGPEPGEAGRAVILGRRSPSGADVFAKLVTAREGDKIVVTTESGEKLTFVVRSVEQFKAGQVPADRVYGKAKAAQLRLITSAGSYDQAKGGFPRNLVVFADLVK